MSDRVFFLTLDEMLYWTVQEGLYDTHIDL